MTANSKQRKKGGAQPQSDPEKLGLEVLEFLDSKKADELMLLHLGEVHSYFDYFLLATASSPMHLKSLVRDVTKTFQEHLPRKGGGIRPADVESGWVIIDFIDLVVHIFLAEQRRFYNLERLWGDARLVTKGQ